MATAMVLIIDDEENLRKLLARIVELEGYTVVQAATAKEGLKYIQRENFQVVVSDVRLPDGNGVELTAKIREASPGTEVIVLTAYGTIEDGVKAIKNGAFDYLTKGEHQQKIIPLLSKATEKALLQQKVFQLESKLQQRYGFQNILGTSEAIQQAIVLAKRVAKADAHVLLLGETGTGKEVFAQSIHYESPRKTKSFIALNCSAFPKDLLESELFGHTAGAYTGATKASKGYLEEANEGTLFLDEIGEMNIDLQAKLLRVLESGEYFKVGESKPRKVNVRIIAATNRNLEQESENGNFRKDLFYRLNVFVIALPSLTERREDIPLLADFFINYFAKKINRRVPVVSLSFLKMLQQHSWKGNVRELKNIIERAIILGDEELNPALLPSDFNNTTEDSLLLTEVEKRHISQVLKQTHGNKTMAAKLLGIGLTTLYQKIKDYQL